MIRFAVGHFVVGRQLTLPVGIEKSKVLVVLIVRVVQIVETKVSL